MSKPLTPLLAFWIVCVAIIGGAFIFVITDDNRGVQSLVALRPLVAGVLVPVGAQIVDHAWAVLLTSLGLFGFLAAFLASPLSAPGPRRILWASVVVAIAGQACLILSYSLAGILAYMIAAGLIFLDNRTRSTGQASTDPQTIDWWDVALIGVIMLPATFLRTYALNEIFDYFEGEISPYMVGAASLRGILVANVGAFFGPWAPLGFFYYLPQYVSISILGSSILAIRVAAVAVTILTVPLTYILVRQLGTRLGAAVSAFFVAIDSLQIGWSRADIYPHGSTTWPAIFIALFTWRYFNRGQTKDLIWLIIFMGLCFHQYPSGQSAVAIPLFYAAALLLFDRPTLFSRGWRTLWLGAGVTLWLVSFPLQYWVAPASVKIPNPVSMFGIRTSWARDGSGAPTPNKGAALFRSVENATALIDGLYFKPPLLHHQDILPSLADVPTPTVLWPVAVLGTLGAVLALRGGKTSRLRGPALLLLCWVICGSLPSIFSDFGYPKRASTMYPALMALAGLTLGDLARGLSRGQMRILLLSGTMGLLTWLPLSSWFWFSGHLYHQGRPRVLEMASALQSVVKPKTIVVVRNFNHYYNGMLMYLLLDHLRKESTQPTALLFYTGSAEDFDKITAEPGRAIEALAFSHLFAWSPVYNSLEKLRAVTDWSHVVFAFQSLSYGQEHLSNLEAINRLSKTRSDCQTTKVLQGQPDQELTFVDCPIAIASK